MLVVIRIIMIAGISVCLSSAVVPFTNQKLLRLQSEVVLFRSNSYTRQYCFK